MGSDPLQHRSVTARYPGVSGFWTWDIPQNIVHGDANLFEYFGLEVARHVGGAPIEDFIRAIHPDDRQRVAVAIQRSVRLASDFREVYRVITRNHSVRSIMATGRCYHAATGKPVQYPGWFADITDMVTTKRACLHTAAFHAAQARDAATAAGQDFVAYLLDAALEEIEQALPQPPVSAGGGKVRN